MKSESELYLGSVYDTSLIPRLGESRFYHSGVRTVTSASALWTVLDGRRPFGATCHAEPACLIVHWVAFPRLFSKNKIWYHGFDNIAREHYRMILRDS